ncbi:ABC transporter permease [Meiothermus sp. CFH 77666]|uniref:ABC transporter permease n=1 Tax=Meiothermus sp. CFH 77666 TaxID=2817942 RepID=UPI001AA062CD|nr:ABC transporter permease [Meiothermus sp. CFH 77666]MBO1438734.1 ABC transporter permease [Meiothermus sp. CFH 77666]
MLRRSLPHLLVLFMALSLNFFLPRAMPGSPLPYLVGEEAARLSPEERARVLAQYGLDKPLPEQFGLYLGRLAQGDLGRSLQSREPVLKLILERLPWTLLLSGSALVLASALGLLLGVLSAWYRGSLLDRFSFAGAVFLDAMPSFWPGMVLIALFAVQWPLFPVFGAYTAWANLQGLALWVDVLRHLALPALTLTLTSLAGLYLVCRYAMLETLGKDYIRTARAKGLREVQVIFKHALRNAALPVFTLFMLNLGSLVGGAVVVETVFSYPGLVVC